ncbi:MAG: M20/M25/M40 family metallo-hydrolase [Thermoanaerobaculia bacterium]
MYLSPNSPAIVIWIGLVVLSAGPSTATVDQVQQHVEYLASDQLDGRLTGTAGERRAADYLVRELEQLGAKPLPGREGFELPFEFTSGSSDAGSTIKIGHPAGERGWTGGEKIQALSFSDSGSVTGPVVFAGYGIVVPAGQETFYDSYTGLDVEDKVVVVLRYTPEDADKETRAALARFSGLRHKALQARERGAKAIVVVTGPRSPNAGETVPMSFDSAIAGSGIVAASIGGEVAEALFELAGDKTLEQAQKSLDDANPHITGFDLPDLEITLDVKVDREKRTGHNIVGVLPGRAAGEVEKPYVVLGAHYDHLGRGRSGGNSLARKEEMGGIHHGADDNASGVAAVLAAAAQLAKMDRQRDVVLAFWSGEELGALGSHDFLASEIVDPGEIAAYVNLDMVGRVRDNKLVLQAAGTSSVWPRLIEQSNIPVGFDLQTRDDPYLPTDTLNFVQAGIPTLDLFTGSHEEYHRPADRAETLNYEDLERVARFGALVTYKTANLETAPDFIEVARDPQSGGGREGARIYTGTIPDYTAEVEGLRLSGVIGGGPAEEAGLQEGDVIVELAGQSVANVYDYMYALEALEIGQAVKVIYLREGTRQETTITPQSRQ